MTNSAILCVDDEEIVLATIKEQLRRRFGSRFHYETAHSADEAWGAIDDLADEGLELLVIVSDWLMPGMRGDEFLVQVHRRFPKVATVLLTGQADEQAIERARREASLAACLHKPWSEDELAGVVERALA
jgi:CheY-like chemotaxis protein